MDIVSTVYNFGVSIMRGIVNDDPAVGLAGCSRSCGAEGRAPAGESSEARPEEPSQPAAQPTTSAAPPSPSSPSVPQNVLITWPPTLAQEMNSHDSVNWQMASWSNGNPFNNTWQPDNVTFNNGIMILRLDNDGCPAGCDSRPYASGEYRTGQETFGHGYYEVRMRAASGSGLVSSFFIYRGTYGQSSHDEIDFEFLGRDCNRVQTNYYVEGRGQHEQMISLDFNACEEFHNYGFRWSEDALAWHIDGREVRLVEENTSTETREIPYRPGKIMVNFWPGTGVDGWLGRFSYPGQPLEAQYDWIRYSTLSAATRQPSPAQSAQPAAPSASPTPTAPTSPLSALLVSDIQTGFFAFNNGHANRRTDGNQIIYVFDADHARDPGFGIITGNHALEGRSILRFEIRGNFQRHAGYARFIAQVYRDSDDQAVPSVSLDPVAVTSNWTEASLDLGDQIARLQKVQFLLVTDGGSCDVEIRNLRFE